jgi:hypothetical protein
MEKINQSTKQLAQIVVYYFGKTASAPVDQSKDLDEKDQGITRP